MPQRNVIKVYVKNGIYHAYNRGVEKRTIFEDKKDYKVLLSYLKQYLSKPPDKSKLLKTFTLKGGTFQGIPKQPKNYYLDIDLLSYCLMPNHYHFMIRQKQKDSMKCFIQSLFTRYSMYFNKRYNRVGKLFQGHYKAVLVKNDTQLLHLSRYIHLNPSGYRNDIVNAYSSYADYLKLRDTPWVKPDFILKFFEGPKNPLFNKVGDYRDFIENHRQDSATVLGNKALDRDL